MSKLHELGNGWTIAGHVATRGNVQVLYMTNPSRYHAKALNHNYMDYDSPLVALTKLRHALLNNLAHYESVLDDIADALASIDAPDAPEACECKTGITLASRDVANGEYELWRCEWECERCWIDYRNCGNTKTERMTLKDAGCPAEYWPENCNNRPDAVIAWFENDFEVTL